MIVPVPGVRHMLIVLSVTATLAFAIASPTHPAPAPAASVSASTERAPPVDTSAVVPRGALHGEGEAVAPRRPRPWWGWILLGRLHPMVVHFPIALLSAAALIELLHVVRRKPVPSEAGTYCLAIGVAGALASVFLGTLNAGQQTLIGDAAAALERHRVMGWISTIAATAALVTGVRARRARQVRTAAAYVGLVLATGAVVSATGHLGGGLVYGEDYLTGVLPWNRGGTPVEERRPAAATSAVAAAPAVMAVPSAAAPSRPVARVPRETRLPGPAPAAAVAPSAEPAVAVAQADAVDFSRDVLPIIKETCVECHGPDKVKARLRMDSIEGLQKGGKSGALVKPGDPENSLMLRRVLGLDDEDRMPLDKDPLTEKQIDALRRWIAAGAPYPATGSQ